MTYFLTVIGIVISLLGGLWLLQGVGLVTIGPVLCVANCTPIIGPDLTWTIVGLVALAIGILIIRFGTRARRNWRQ